MCPRGHLLPVIMHVPLGLLFALTCSVVLASPDSSTATVKPQQCVTQTAGIVTGKKYVLLETVLSQEIRNWQIKITKKPPTECDTVSAMEATVCDIESLPEVELNEYTVTVHRTGNISQVGSLKFTVYCEAV